ncbi:MAG: hypothetical protein PHY12_08850 [Eubacteriales bacterium]|nr:hypothetical protein [Eubacteriales bacterium]
MEKKPYEAPKVEVEKLEPVHNARSNNPGASHGHVVPGSDSSGKNPHRGNGRN